uniref:Transthyretin-like family protein n=1 Tax=Elaeophora elaphi TaxID=1147741 RepID=A0A0R3RYK3_9BILA
MLTLKVAVIILLLVTFAYCKMQTIMVKGQVACNDRSVNNVHVELREADTWDPDDSLSATHSDRHGHFEVSGQEDELGSIEPYLRITHSCNDGIIDPKCRIVDDYQIPKDYINDIYNMGIVSLNIAQEGREKKCA